MMFSVTPNYDDTYGSDGICRINEVEMSLMVIKHNRLSGMLLRTFKAPY
jgi:hypothetical protein